jgi:hypothetical protein
MLMTPKKRDRGAPAAGSSSFVVDDLGEPRYHTPVGPAKGVIRPVPSDAVAVTDPGEPLPAGGAANSTYSLVPASEEVAKLPRGAREAFAVRCAARVARLRAGATSPEAAAALILAAATVETPIRRQLLCIRRDFDRLVARAKKHGWTDDTRVSPEVFGPIWPKNLTPPWVAESPAAEASGK